MAVAIITVENLSFTYPEAPTPALKNINFTVEAGEFVVIMGSSGCGKSTLLRQLKREIAPHGTLAGKLYYQQTELAHLPAREAAANIGFVMQNPENQIITDKVWHELAFGLENLGLDTLTIRRRVAEMANFFGIQKWFRQDTATLSGGQKQLLNLAAVMVMQPTVLLLDEPTSQLDPIAAMEFITTIKRLNQELGLTVILIEHRLEDVLPIADSVYVMDQGELKFAGPPTELIAPLADLDFVEALPSSMRIFYELGGQGKPPLTVREGRTWLAKQDIQATTLPVQSYEPKHTVLEAKGVYFRYSKDGQDILRQLNLTIGEGELFTLLGGNGTGKTTALKVLAGLEKQYRGEVKIFGKKIKSYKKDELYRNLLGVLPQDPKVLFVEKTVQADLMHMQHSMKLPNSAVEEVVSLLGLHYLLERHPYDLSGGEQQKVALAKLLLLKPKIILLDEPTKGLDVNAKKQLAEVLRNLQQQGITLVMVTHDIEFSARYSDRCALFFDGSIVSEGMPHAFYSGNNFYTTAAHRISRHKLVNAITPEDVVSLCKK